MRTGEGEEEEEGGKLCRVGRNRTLMYYSIRLIKWIFPACVHTWQLRHLDVYLDSSEITNNIELDRISEYKVIQIKKSAKKISTIK